MPTDDERRAVAQGLREVQSDVIPGTKTEAHPIAGRIIGVACGYDLPDFQGLLGYLADLIDPGELKTTCIAEVKIEGEKLDEAVNRAIAEYTGIDRGALLELADEIHGLVENQEIRFFHVVQVHESTLATIERRIREACGEEGR